jgi:exosortase F-associated protein
MEAAARITTTVRVGLALTGFTLIAVSYLYQYTDVLIEITGKTYVPEAHFIANRVFRIILNDVGMILIIYAIFVDRQILRLAVFIQAIDLLVLLPIYLLIKLPTEGISELSSPFLSQFHRVIVNPILMILLIPAIYYQRITKNH